MTESDDLALTTDEIRQLVIAEFRERHPHLAIADIDAVSSSSDTGELVPELPTHLPGDLLSLGVEAVGELVEVVDWACVRIGDDTHASEFQHTAITSADSAPLLRCGPPGIIEVVAIRVRFAQGGN